MSDVGRRKSDVSDQTSDVRCLTSEAPSHPLSAETAGYAEGEDVEPLKRYTVTAGEQSKKKKLRCWENS